MATAADAKAFMSSPHFAVVGASSDPTKFGHKVFTFYTHHSLPVTPINPSTPQIKAFPPWPSLEIQSYNTVPSVSSLPNPTSTSVSIITPPKVTLKVLQEAAEAGVPAVWMQPGSYDAEGWKFAKEKIGTVVAGDGGRGGEGWCVLVDGEGALRSAGKLKRGAEGGQAEGEEWEPERKL